MNQGELEYLELICKQLYESTDPQQRNAAEKAIEEFTDMRDCLQKCYLLLERGSSAYAQHIAATTLKKLISKPSPSISLEERIELRNYLLNYLVTRPKLPVFVVSSLCTFFARLTKLSWFDTQRKSSSGGGSASVGGGGSSLTASSSDDGSNGSGSSEEFVFRASIEEIMKFEMQGSMEMCSLAVQLLSHLVEEINQQTGMSSIAKHRQISASFRDTYLFGIFQLAVRLLQSACDNIKTISLEDENQKNLLTNLLQLALNCLNFDFIGSMFDDTTDENVSVQMPTAWRVAFIDASIVKLFYSLYAVLPPELAALALSCLVQLASVRRTIFNTSERQSFLSALVAGVKAILENPQGLADQSTYHEFCRLIARLKTNYQLTELIKMDEYPKFMRMITEFTVTSLQMFRFSANSIHYLLSFWQRMVSSMPYVKMSEPHLLEQHAPIVTKGYIETRLNLPAAVIQEAIEDPLEDQSSMNQQMEQLSVIGRCEYEKTCQLLIQLFDQSAAAYQQAVQQNQQLEQTLEEGRLSWCVYIIGSAIAGRVACNSSDEHELIDGDLICRVLQLIRLTDQRLPTHGAEKLEVAYLWFLEQFRKIYISDQVQKNTKVYHKLTEVLGITDDAMVLAVFVQKIITNLKYWSTRDRIIDVTLALLNDLSIGYSSVRKLARLPEIQFLLSNHTNEHFSFLGTTADLRTMKSRTTFYTALTRLLCVELGEDEDQFQQYVAPLTNAFNELSKMCDMPESSLVNQLEAKRVIIGLARDVRGIGLACNIKSTYIMLFDWIYPNYLTILHRAIEVWYSEPSVTTPLLKLMCELCQNRSQRLLFDVSSPNAILLFKEASKWICSYGSRILTISDIPKEQLYATRLKGIMVCFGILRAAMCGAYVNFGVFRLYRDSCLDDAFGMFVKMVLAIPQADLLAYSKLSHNYFTMLESLAQDHMAFLSHLEPQIFVYILQTLHEGLTALDTMVCTCCCSTLDNMITYLYRRISRGAKPRPSHAGIAPEGDNCLRVLDAQPDVMRQTLSTILNVIMFDECRCQWSMSRPMLGLILLNEEYFNRLKMQVVSGQPADKQQRLLLCFDALMENIERNLTVKNKDKFTQNVSHFRRQVADCLKGANGDSMGPISNLGSPYGVDMMS